MYYLPYQCYISSVTAWRYDISIMSVIILVLYYYISIIIIIIIYYISINIIS